MPRFTPGRSRNQAGANHLGRVRGHVAVLIVCTLTLAACAPSFQGHNLQPLGAFRPLPEPARKPTAACSLEIRVGKPPALSNEILQSELAEMPEECPEVLRQSGYFASVSTVEPADVHITAGLTVTKTSSLPLKVAMIASLLIVPSYETERYHLSAKVTSADGVFREYELTDSMTTVYSLLLVPSTLIAGDGPFVGKRVRMNMWKTLVSRIQQDGLLPDRPQPSAVRAPG